MNLKAAVQLSLIASLALGTACGAATPAKKQPKTAAPQVSAAPVTTPELQGANERVKQAESQLSLAKKQLGAAKSILRAAEADLKAARAEREAIALRTTAQGLAADAGMHPDTNRSLAQASSAAVTAANRGGAAPSNTAAIRTQQLDNAAPGAVDPADTLTTPVELR